MKNFRELTIWQDAIEFTHHLYNVLDQLPVTEKFGLYNQMTRASVSIPSNIAEGCRGSIKEHIHFLNIALGSTFELETQIYVVRKIKMLDEAICLDLISNLNTLQKQINAYRNFVIKQKQP